jgi:hypothetical protein
MLSIIYQRRQSEKDTYRDPRAYGLPTGTGCRYTGQVNYHFGRTQSLQITLC